MYLILHVHSKILTNCKAFASVKADYDKVEEFFSYSSRFYERLTILEGMVSDNAALARAIVRVFSAQLSVCAIVEVWTKTKAARFKQFLSALWNMQDPALASSFGTMQASVDELGATVGYASYAEIKSTKAVTLTVSAKADEIDANIKGFRDKVGKDLQLIYESQLGMREQMADGFHTIHRTQTLLLDRFEQDAARKEALEAERAAREARFQETMLKALQEKGKADHAESKRKQNTKNLGKGDPADKKIKALNAIKDFFMKHDDTFLQWKDAYKENSSQEKEMTDVYVEHTAEWITTEPAFQQWTEGNNPLLWMKGPDGIGKSFLAHVSLQKLRARDNGNNSFAYFYFKEDSPYLQSAQNAIACVALQVAEANSRYAEQIAAKLKEEGENAPSTSTWEKIFLSIFGEAPNGTDSDDHFYLIFDGLDESPKEQQEVFLEFLQKLLGAKSRLHVLITSRPSVGALQKVEPLTLDVTKEKMLDDMRTIVGNRINKSDRLKKFSPKGKAIIRRTVSQHADGTLPLLSHASST